MLLHVQTLGSSLFQTLEEHFYRINILSEPSSSSWLVALCEIKTFAMTVSLRVPYDTLERHRARVIAAVKGSLVCRRNLTFKYGIEHNRACCYRTHDYWCHRSDDYFPITKRELLCPGHVVNPKVAALLPTVMKRRHWRLLPKCNTKLCHVNSLAHLFLKMRLSAVRVPPSDPLL